MFYLVDSVEFIGLWHLRGEFRQDGVVARIVDDWIPAIENIRLRILCVERNLVKYLLLVRDISLQA